MKTIKEILSTDTLLNEKERHNLERKNRKLTNEFKRFLRENNYVDKVLILAVIDGK
jgi:uncharacterized membrane protein